MSTDRIRDLLARAPVLDGHNDLPWALRTRTRYRREEVPGLHTDLARLAAGGVGGQFWSVFVSHRLGDHAVAATLEQIDFVRRWVATHPDRLVLATTADEVEAAHRSGRLASLIGMEGGHSIAGSLGALRMMYELGARYMTLTHIRNTPWADSATDAPAVGGLSPFGHEVVREMNRLGMLVDLSHVAPATMHAALDTSTAPAFFSHSSARALCDHPRNVPDDVLRRVRDSGGVVMVTFVPGFLTEACRSWMGELATEEERLVARYPEDSAAYATAQAAWVAANPRPPCGVADVADHVEHVRAVAGVDAVGLGGDFDGVVTTPDGLPDVSGYPALLAELAGRGWSDADLAGLTWHNAVRVLRESEAAARAARPRRGPSLATMDDPSHLL
ncbi:dipeptidase [Rhizomonospora bruguierae]|uniref:dipeptidase n=1 Tax=Rhizomonospora bruguierae TaxID=1581705 RepID=UPI001BCF9812|nr:dipeptidase [Micromonospora sp. NBRC 107566]